MSSLWFVRIIFSLLCECACACIYIMCIWCVCFVCRMQSSPTQWKMRVCARLSCVCVRVCVCVCAMYWPHIVIGSSAHVTYTRTHAYSNVHSYDLSLAVLAGSFIHSPTNLSISLSIQKCVWITKRRWPSVLAAIFLFVFVVVLVFFYFQTLFWYFFLFFGFCFLLFIRKPTKMGFKWKLINISLYDDVQKNLFQLMVFLLFLCLVSFFGCSWFFFVFAISFTHSR